MKRIYFPLILSIICLISDCLSAQATSNQKILVAYFSQTGTTQRVAELIAELTGADTYRILAADPYEGNGYPDSERVQEEAYNDMRPEVANLPESIDEYDVIFVGTPIWWHYPAMVVCTFLDNYDFSGKTVIPFCTYGATTWMQQTMDKIRELTPNSIHLQDFGTSGSTNGVEGWLNEIGMTGNTTSIDNDNLDNSPLFRLTGNDRNVNISFNNNELNEAYLEIFDYYGREIFNTKIQGDHTLLLNSGIYIFKVSGTNRPVQVVRYRIR